MHRIYILVNFEKHCELAWEYDTVATIVSYISHDILYRMLETIQSCASSLTLSLN